jgi:hypothetical protein
MSKTMVNITFEGWYANTRFVPGYRPQEIQKNWWRDSEHLSLAASKARI